MRDYLLRQAVRLLIEEWAGAVGIGLALFLVGMGVGVCLTALAMPKEAEG